MCNFYLRKKDKQGLFTVYLYVNAGGKQVYTSTGIKVSEKEWDKRKQLAKDADINARLITLARLADKWAEQTTDVSNANLKDYIIQHLNVTDTQQVEVTENQTDSNFFQVIDDFISKATSRLNADGERIGKRRIDVYGYERNALAKFEQVFGKKLSFENFDYQTLAAFQTFLTNKNLANNTVVRYFKVLRVLFVHAEKIGIDVCQDYRKYHNIKQNKKGSVVLSEQEIELIWQYQPANEKEANVKKLFLIGLHTGLRFSDYSTLTNANINYNDMTINIIQQKTGQRVTLPLHPRLAQMLQTEELPHAISNQKLNKYIKILMKNIGINEIIQTKKIIGGKRVVEYHQKWELVSSHTCRRSFATNLYKAGVNPSIIMLCTGHRDLGSFMKYIVLDNNDKLQVVRNLWNSTAI